MSAIASQSRRPFTPTLREELAVRPSQFARSTCFEAGHLTSVNAGWRSVRPVIDAEQCTLCLNCYMYCPDGTIAKVRDDEGACVAVVVDYDFCKGCGVCAKVCPVPCIAMVDEHAGENEGASETAETLDETSPSAEMGPATEGRLSMRNFLSGNEAFAEGVRLARPQVISAYPITPQTTVVEALASMVEDGSLSAEYLHVESEHTALAAAIGAAATGARTFTATSSQGLLYMAECLTYASGGRFPIVMMNANRALALPWNIYGDQRDSLSLLDHGWIQVYAESNQEALDLALMAYAVAEDPRVSLPVMVNVDGFALTHTYESVEVPTADEADAFLPPYRTANKFDFENPVNIGYSAGPDFNRYYQYWHHRDMLAVGAVVEEVEARFAEVFGRAYPGMVDAYLCEDADFVLVTLGSAAGLARDVADELRAAGKRAGVLRIRYLRPMPDAALARALVDAAAVGVLEQDISFGGTGTVYANVLASLARAGVVRPSANFIGGLGGDDISREAMRGAFAHLEALAAGEGASGEVVFFGVEEEGGKR